MHRLRADGLTLEMAAIRALAFAKSVATESLDAGAVAGWRVVAESGSVFHFLTTQQ